MMVSLHSVSLLCKIAATHRCGFAAAARDPPLSAGCLDGILQEGGVGIHPNVEATDRWWRSRWRATLADTDDLANLKVAAAQRQPQEIKSTSQRSLFISCRARLMLVKACRASAAV